MNKLTLENTRDFALSTDGLKFMQDAYSILEKLSVFGGLNYVVSGCEVTGSSAASGYIVLKGILMPFSGGTINTNVRIVKDVQTVTVDNGSREQTAYHAEFGTSTNPNDNVSWSSIKKLVDIPTIVNRLIAIENLSSGNNTRLTAVETLSSDNDKRLTSVESLSSGNGGRLTKLEYETNWHGATLLEGSADLATELLALKRKGNVVHYRIYFRFNKENPTTYPKWLLPDWAIVADSMYSSGHFHHARCLYEKMGGSLVNMLPATFFTATGTFPKSVKIERGYAPGTTFGHSYTGNEFIAEGTYLV